jgi:septum formation protein
VKPRLYIASRSPRRRELLRQIGIDYQVLLLREDPGRGVDVDETVLESETPEAYVLRIARRKAEVAAWVRERRGLPALPVLAADTSVVCDDFIMGKPEDDSEAAAMLQVLSGRQHEVLSAVAIAFRGRLETTLSRSSVWFRNLTAEEVRRYIATREPFDKAGAYAVQGRAAVFITRIEGSFSGIMGLPLAETAELLRRFGVESL